MILVVDDHADTVSFLCRILKRRGYDTSCAYDGTEALQILATSTPQLVILDVQMPGKTGIDVLTEMRADQRLKNVPVVMYSAGFEKSQYDLAMTLGATRYIVKGAVSVPEILAVVAQHAMQNA